MIVQDLVGIFRTNRLFDPNKQYVRLWHSISENFKNTIQLCIRGNCIPERRGGSIRSPLHRKKKTAGWWLLSSFAISKCKDNTYACKYTMDVAEIVKNRKSLCTYVSCVESWFLLLGIFVTVMKITCRLWVFGSKEYEDYAAMCIIMWWKKLRRREDS